MKAQRGRRYDAERRRQERHPVEVEGGTYPMLGASTVGAHRCRARGPMGQGLFRFFVLADSVIMVGLWRSRQTTAASHVRRVSVSFSFFCWLETGARGEDARA